MENETEYHITAFVGIRRIFIYCNIIFIHGEFIERFYFALSISVINRFTIA